MNNFVSKLSLQFSKKWIKCGRRLDRFFKFNYQWLESVLNIPQELIRELKSNIVEDSNKPSMSRDRPKKCFGESSYRSRRRKAKWIAEEQSSEAIMLAAELGLRWSGKRDAANIVKELTLVSPKRATKIKKARRLFESKQKRISAKEALAFYVRPSLLPINIEWCTIMVKI